MKTALVVLTALLCFAASAEANTLTFSGSISPASDPGASTTTLGITRSTCSSAAPAQYSVAQHYDAYALRNTSGAEDCVTVNVAASGCDDQFGSVAYLGSFNPAATTAGFAGGLEFTFCGPPAEMYDVAVPAGTTVVPIVLGIGSGGAYQLNASGASLVLADTVDAAGSLPKNNTFSLRASVLKDGTGAEGTVSVSSTAGKAYSGAVQCLRVDGENATLIASITGGNQDPRFKAVAFWLHETVGAAGGQRNSLLTQAELDRLHGHCPVPGSKATSALSSGHVSVVDTPDADAPPV